MPSPYHYPGTNYLGPGTDVVNSIRGGLEPTSYIDSLARQHDIDYLRSSGSAVGAFVDDAKAQLGAILEPFSLQSLSMRAGLGARTLLNGLTLGYLGNFNQSLPGLSTSQTRAIGDELQAIVDRQQ